ncbi:hypothetical protein SLEP1_g16668 [Rubroshorea leprosula]|uniref:Uncharacterized protein n=1 Tax=Rubroshorea leprosula TaxID=152421 RepID=A0AAV5J0E9_9ROSI|nr:hypothetical protein SLEP1_g16668 [Rubroshorea leprosula]
MSSERTQSIVGSEVMPLDYGRMDSESSPSPSSSENTVEGVRGDEVIEVGEEEVVEVGGNDVVRVGGGSIPITVVEVKGRGEREYDVNAEIVEEVQQYRSELRTRDSLGHLVENYEISSRVLVRPAGVEERACSAPRDHWMPIYSHYLLAGLRFPIPELLVGLLLDYKIGLTQLVPNAMRGGSMRDEGWYYFTPRVANRESRFSLNEDEEEEVRRLVRKRGDLLNIMDLTSAQCIEAAKLYGPSALSEAKMYQFLNTAGGAAIPKKLRKKSKTSTKQVDEGRARKEVVPMTSTEVEEEVPQLKRKGWEERRALQKKQRVVEEETGNEVPVFVPRPSPVVHQQHLPRSGPMQRAVGSSEVWWSIRGEARSRERELGEWSSPGIQGEPEGSFTLAEAARPAVEGEGGLEQERASLSTKLVFEESKRRISESEREAQAQELKLTKEAFLELKANVQTLVHNGMKEHINNLISSSSFDSIVNLYRLPIAIIAFTDCRKKVKAEYPEVDVTKITFGEQEGGVEEDGESMSADFRPQIKLRWEDDADGLAVFPPQFDFEFVAVEEERAEVEEDEMEAGVEGTEVDESQLVLEVEIYPVPSDDEQPPLPDEQQPTQPPPPTE